jgi:hypothetical protein
VTTVHRGHFSRDDRAAEPYRYLPVDVPPGAAGLTVTLRYDGSAGVLDLGCFGPAGFRGWSGSARGGFAIGATTATPGYLPGPLEPGVWQVLLGLHRVGAGGLGWEVTAAAGRAEPQLPAEPSQPAAAPAPDQARRRLPATSGLRWLAGDLHAHTVHSDGALTVDELARLGRQRGLDFLAVTDHNTVSHHAGLAAASARTELILLPGQEVTTAAGHANVLGDVGWIDFRQPADDWLAQAERGGGLLSVNHPLAGDCAWRQPMSRRPRHAEIWHWSWLERRWGGPLAWWQAFDPELIPLGGSDFHRPGSDALPGAPTTWVGCEASRVDSGDAVGALLAGLRSGRVAVSAGYADPVLLRVDGDFVAVGADGLLLADAAGRRTPIRCDLATLPAAPGPAWLADHDTAVIALAR